LTIVGQALFGADLDDDADQLVAAVLTALDGVIARARTPLSLPLAVPTPANRRFRAALATIDAAAARLIADRRRTPRAESDLLALLLAARDAETGQPMSDRQLRDEIVTFIVAGHETVASALTWTWHLLGQAPAVTAQLTTELTTVLAGRPPTFDDLPRLPLVRQIVDEALRLYPPAWLITRRAVTEDWLDDYRLPPGALVVISPYQLHRRASLWPAPERFQPERFTPAASAERPRFSYLPFGGGPRICIGNSFALIEAQLIVATIAQHYRLHPVADRPVVVEPLVTLRPRHGLPMRLQPLATATPPPYSGLPLDWS
jgi:cytochrome P450